MPQNKSFFNCCTCLSKDGLLDESEVDVSTYGTFIDNPIKQYFGRASVNRNSRTTQDKNMSEKLKVIVFLSSARVGESYLGNGSWGDRVGGVIKEVLDDADFEVSVWDPKANPYQVLQQPMHMIKDTSVFPQWMHDKKAELESADAFFICSAEYNSVLPPALTNMLDHYPPAAYKHRPVALVTYSVSPLGGVRVQPALKTLVTELGMLPIPTIGRVAQVRDKFVDDILKDEGVRQSMTKQAKELSWYARALKTYKADTPMPS